MISVAGKNIHCGIIPFMQNDDLDEIVPTSLNNDDSLNDSLDSADTGNRSIHEPEKKKSPWRLIALSGVLVLLLIAVISAWGGYTSGVSARTAAEATQISGEAETQYNLGVQDLEQGQYARARQRFEYVIEINPSYPGVTDRLAEVLLLINATATPSPVPTASITPTPDTRESDEIEALYSQAEQMIANDNWAGAIDTLLLVRKKDSSYQVIGVDGMLFIALRNQGIEKIVNQADLEGGVYDLGLAEQFGPLDSEAQGYLSWAKLYITGASFWELDWGQAVYYFSQVAPQLPGLRDGSGWTAKERYRLALLHFADTLLLAGDPCQALENYQLSISLGYDAEAEASMTEAIRLCEGTKPQQPAGDSPSQPPSDLPDPGQQPDPYPSP